jgi:hypothetical protein
MDSMFSELCVLDKKGTWTPVDPNTLSKQELKRIIRSFMFLTEKYDAEGEFLKLKSRLVAMGNEQDKEMLQMRPDYRPFLNDRRELTVKLEKALYGCIQSARLWYDTFSAFLCRLGYKKNERDACVFNKVSTTGMQCTVVFSC